MQVLDESNEPARPRGAFLGTVAAGGLVVGLVACIAILYAKWQLYSIHQASATPDATQLSAATGLLQFAQLAAIFGLFLGVMLQRIAFTRMSFRPSWMWLLQLTCGVVGILMGGWSYNIAILFLGVSLLIHAMAQREAYHTAAA
jgi:hypothetical protein